MNTGDIRSTEATISKDPWGSLACHLIVFNIQELGKYLRMFRRRAKEIDELSKLDPLKLTEGEWTRLQSALYYKNFAIDRAEKAASWLTDPDGQCSDILEYLRSSIHIDDISKKVTQMIRKETAGYEKYLD